jgi:hypothetical protein
MMKVFSLILVMLVLALNLVPCADVQETAETTKAAVHQQTHADQHAPFMDTCSPFCHCSCCANSFVAQLLQLSSVPFTTYKNTTVPYISGKYIDVSLPVWQPPQWV